MTEYNPLDRIPGETKTAYAAFLDYAHMGPKRSIRLLASRYQRVSSESGQPPPTRRLNTLFTWSLKNHWADRSKAFDIGQHEKEIADYEEARKEERRLRIQLLRATRSILSERLACIATDDLDWNALLRGIKVVVEELRKEFDDEPMLKVVAMFSDMTDDDLRSFIASQMGKLETDEGEDSGV